MEKVMPSFEFEPLVLSPELEISNEEEDIGNIDGVGQLNTKTTKEGTKRPQRREGPKRVDVGKTNTSK